MLFVRFFRVPVPVSLNDLRTHKGGGRFFAMKECDDYRQADSPEWKPSAGSCLSLFSAGSRFFTGWTSGTPALEMASAARSGRRRADPRGVFFANSVFFNSDQEI